MNFYIQINKLNMNQKHIKYSEYIKEKIMNNDEEIQYFKIANIDKNLYNTVFKYIYNCDKNGILNLIKKGVDLSHIYYIQPECFILNAWANSVYTIDEKKEFINFIIKYIDINAVPLEKYKTNSFNINIPVPTLLDSVIESGHYYLSLTDIELNIIIEILRENGAKLGSEIEYDHNKINKLSNFILDDKNFGYDYNTIKTYKYELHFELIAYLFHPTKIQKYLENNDNIEDYLS